MALLGINWRFVECGWLICDQAEQNRGNFTWIKDENTLNIYVKCDRGYVKIWQYDGKRGWEGMPKYDGWWQLIYLFI